MIFVVQNILIGLGMLLLVGIPAVFHFVDPGFAVKGVFFTISFTVVFLLMVLRPLADITGWLWLRKLIVLRKGLGVLSASIIVGFMIDNILAPQSTYLASLATGKYFSLDNFALFAHLGDITGVILLLTSNRLAQKILKQNWKRVQRLSYIYFFAGGLYEAFALNSRYALYAILLIWNLTILAWVVKFWKRLDIVPTSVSLPPA